MLFLQKYLVPLTAIALLAADFFNGLNTMNLGGTFLVLLIALLFASFLKKSDVYFAKVRHCFKIGYLSLFLFALLNLIASVATNELGNGNIFVKIIRNFFAELPQAVARLFFGALFITVIGFVVPLFFWSTNNERDDILDL